MRRIRGDGGSAIIEFVFVTVVVLVPLVYVIAAVASVQRSSLAVSQAARDAGRAFATSDDDLSAYRRVRAAVRLALTAQGLPDDVDVRFVGASASCSARAIAPHVAPGAEYAVCVSRHAELPGVPTVLTGRGVTTIGRFVVHLDDFRTVGGDA